MSRSYLKPKACPVAERKVSFKKAKTVKKGRDPNGYRSFIKSRIPRDTLTGRITGVESFNASLVIASVKHGLRYDAVEQLESALKVSSKRVSEILSIPASTLTRRKREGVLKPDESDRVVRYSSLYDSVVELLEGDTNAASNWLGQPLDILDGESPAEHAITEIGAREVSSLIGRIRHGVFS